MNAVRGRRVLSRTWAPICNVDIYIFRCVRPSVRPFVGVVVYVCMCTSVCVCAFMCVCVPIGRVFLYRVLVSFLHESVPFAEAPVRVPSGEVISLSGARA